MQETSPRHPAYTWPAWLLVALSGVALFTFFAAVWQRIDSPWPLEWMEGASLQHAQRLLTWQPLYVPPSAEFIPYLYPPLGYLPMALFCALFSPTLTSARLASLACTLATLWLVGRTGARATKQPVAGLCSAGLFAMGYGYAGAFLDLVRIDACFILLLALAAERLSAGRPRAALLSLALCAFAKQHGLVLLLATSLSVLGSRKERGFVLATWGAVLTLGVALHVHSAGFFSRYTLGLPLSHGLHPELLLSYFAVDVLLFLPVLAIAAAIDIVPRLRKLDAFDALLLASLLVSALGRAHPGGHDNVRLPGFLMLCMLVVPKLATGVLHSEKPVRYAAALAFQFAMLWQSPSLHAPSSQSSQDFRALTAALSRCASADTPVVLDHALLTGRPFLHSMALSDLRLGRDHELARLGTEALLAALPGTLAVGERFSDLNAALDAGYEECTRVRSPELATGFQPGQRTDSHVPLQIIYRKKFVAPPR